MLAILFFSTHVQSLDSTELADRWYSHIALNRAEGRSQHDSTTTTASQPLPLHCRALRQELAAAQFALTNCELLAASPLPLQSTSTSSPLCSSLRSEKFALCNSSSHSHAPIVSEKTTEQEQGSADSTHELLCHRHLQANVSERTSIPPILASSLTFATGMDPGLPNNESLHRHSLGNLLDFATGLDPVLPLKTSHGMRVGSIDCIQPSTPLPQSPRVTRKSTGESLTTALTGFASTCDADLPYTRDPTRPFAPESALSTYSPLLVFPHHTAEEPLGADESTFSILRGTLSSMTGTVHEWFKSAATSFHTWSSHATSGWHSAAGFAETSPAQETTTQTRVFTKGMATNGCPLPLQSPSLKSTSGYDYSICPSHAQETMTQTHRVFTMGMPTIGSPLPPQSESLNLTCGASTMGTPINGNPLQSQPLTVESTSGYDYSICHLSSHRISSLAVNARHAIGSQELIRTTVDHNLEETRFHVLSSDLATRKVFANNLDIEESLPSSRMTTNDHLSDTPSTNMSADLATCKVFAHQPHESTTLEWAKCTHDIEEDLPHPTTLENFVLVCTFYTTFNPSFHSSEPVDDDGFLPPILDTGATHCLLPLDWLVPEQAAFSKRIHLKVASGSSVRALLYNNMIYCATVSRPLLSVGQLKAMLDLRLVWDDSAPCLLACSGGLQYVLLSASVVHHLPVVSHEELHVLIEAIHLFTETGQLWDARQWSQKLGRKLSLYHWGVPITSFAH